MEPKPFNMADPADVMRWFGRMKGYLRTEDFVFQGTDRVGREYALRGLLDLEKILIPGG